VMRTGSASTMRGWRGVSRVGCLHAGDPAQLAERLFDKGYRSASITNFQGDEVGGVCRELDNPRRRTWWAERDPVPAPQD